MTTHLALIEKTQSLIAAGDIVGAEAALVGLADDEGDAALMVVLEQLPPKDVLAVIREYDNSKASVVSLLLTPAQFARAVVIEKLYKDLTRTHLRGMVNAVIFREDADPVEFLTAIGDLEGGSEALADYFSDQWSRVEGFARSGSFDPADEYGKMLSQSALLASAYERPRVQQDEIADNDWMQLAWLLRYELPDLFIEMLMVLRAKGTAHRSSDEEDEDDAQEDVQDDNKVETGDTDRGKATPTARESDEESAI
ncbi:MULTISPECIES: hypothetical protein [unclassified Polaromonas]|uniref:hypothetical protein n=1 Tax=unclassified Polaromonas TaxID=2638319 RepID=UPI000F08671D|nr:MULTISPECIES: hypothetical protein [unclassified Polaromonas]AYQ28547.1 hypothetical protein DT070_11255 [Polaromonas sp. SP1]QGJ20337.1 hypothetical protein F7R28_19350 [Polaromonas sp. Pch-P]